MPNFWEFLGELCEGNAMGQIEFCDGSHPNLQGSQQLTQLAILTSDTSVHRLPTGQILPDPTALCSAWSYCT